MPAAQPIIFRGERSQFFVAKTGFVRARGQCDVRPGGHGPCFPAGLPGAVARRRLGATRRRAACPQLCQCRGRHRQPRLGLEPGGFVRLLWGGGRDACKCMTIRRACACCVRASACARALMCPRPCLVRHKTQVVPPYFHARACLFCVRAGAELPAGPRSLRRNSSSLGGLQCFETPLLIVLHNCPRGRTGISPRNLRGAVGSCSASSLAAACRRAARRSDPFRPARAHTRSASSDRAAPGYPGPESAPGTAAAEGVGGWPTHPLQSSRRVCLCGCARGIGSQVPLLRCAGVRVGRRVGRCGESGAMQLAHLGARCACVGGRMGGWGGFQELAMKAIL